MTAGGLHHLDLNVSDLRRSVAFYREVLGRLGYEESEAGEGWVSLRDRDSGFYVTLVQSQDRFVARGFHRKAVGVNHLAFPVASRADVDALCSWLIERDVPVLYGGTPLEMGTDEAPNYAVFFEDPDRLKLEVVYRHDRR